ncbi:MAG: DUF4349 domain-containing protein [Chloroflexi bacterium]|nr:DUF4349 domain-containing protein [Chloroflexota bacterium]
MKKRLLLMVLAIILLPVLAACASGGESKAPGPVTSEPGFVVPQVPPAPRPAPAPAPMPPVMVAPDKDLGGGFAGGVDAGLPAFDRMIVRTADVALVVDDVPEAINNIAGLAEDAGGHVVNSRRWREGDRLIGNISIRVPAAAFSDILAALRGLAVEVLTETTSSQDVTEEYTDLSAKLRNLEATEEQLLVLITRAEKVGEVLEVQRELSRVRGEIEQIKGRLQLLERTTETSLIQVRLEQSMLDVKLTADQTRVKEGQAIQFFGQVAGGFAPYSFEWDFGDGATGTGAAPAHTYRNEGSYTVILKVTDDRGNTDTETRSEYIIVMAAWDAGAIVGDAWNGMVSLGRGLANVLIWAGVFSPVWIVIGGLAYYLIRRRKAA